MYILQKVWTYVLQTSVKLLALQAEPNKRALEERDMACTHRISQSSLQTFRVSKAVWLRLLRGCDVSKVVSQVVWRKASRHPTPVHETISPLNHNAQLSGLNEGLTESM
jgi:hypothetical protein